MYIQNTILLILGLLLSYSFLVVYVMADIEKRENENKEYFQKLELKSKIYFMELKIKKLEDKTK